jgi:hypothetical protein
MKVRAKAMGYYDHKRRREDDLFEIKSEKEFSPRWMVKVGQEESVDDDQETVKPSARPKRKPVVEHSAE